MNRYIHQRLQQEQTPSHNYLPMWKFPDHCPLEVSFELHLMPKMLIMRLKWKWLLLLWSIHEHEWWIRWKLSDYSISKSNFVISIANQKEKKNFKWIYSFRMFWKFHRSNCAFFVCFSNVIVCKDFGMLLQHLIYPAINFVDIVILCPTECCSR